MAQAQAAQSRPIYPSYPALTRLAEGGREGAQEKCDSANLDCLSLPDCECDRPTGNAPGRRRGRGNSKPTATNSAATAGGREGGREEG